MILSQTRIVDSAVSQLKANTRKVPLDGAGKGRHSMNCLGSQIKVNVSTLGFDCRRACTGFSLNLTLIAGSALHFQNEVLQELRVIGRSQRSWDPLAFSTTGPGASFLSSRQESASRPGTRGDLGETNVHGPAVPLRF